MTLGPAQGDHVTNSRLRGFSPGAFDTRVAGYIEGTLDSQGGTSLTSEILQRRPVTMRVGNYSVEVPDVSAIDVTMLLTLASAYSWTVLGGATTVNGASDATHLLIVGDSTADNGKDVLVNVGTGSIRGAYQFLTLNTGIYDGFNTTYTYASGVLLGVPTGTVRPAPTSAPGDTSIFNAMRLAMFAYFDAFGPGPEVSPSQRWPGEEVAGPSTFWPPVMATASL